MKRLVLARMDDHTKKIDTLTRHTEDLSMKVAVLCDREDRESLLAKNAAIKWGSGVGAVVGGIVSAAVSMFRD